MRSTLCVWFEPEFVPQDELWVKLGGDKGGSSFKMNFQLVNTPRPNSVQNTCVFTVFEAPDSTTNLHLTLSRYQEDVTQLQSYTSNFQADIAVSTVTSTRTS